MTHSYNPLEGVDCAFFQPFLGVPLLGGKGYSRFKMTGYMRRIFWVRTFWQVIFRGGFSEVGMF